MSETVHKVKYIGGEGIELPYPLQDGRTTIPGHVVIELTHYSDFVRLTESPLFVEVKDEAPTRSSTAATKEAPVEAPVEVEAVAPTPPKKSTTSNTGE